MLSYIVSNSGTVSAVVDGKAYTLTPEHPQYLRCKEALLHDRPADFQSAADTRGSILRLSGGSVTIQNGAVCVGTLEVSNGVVDRILQAIEERLPWEPMARFLEKLLLNPSRRSVQELFKFLDNKNLPICEDGDFLGYKRVTPEFRDLHTQTVDNRPGVVNEIARNEVDDDWRTDCSNGFHVGSMNYVSTFYEYGNNPIVLVKVNPRDVVSVPADDTTKLRTCRYEVVKVYTGDLTHAFDRGDGTPLRSVSTINPDDDDDEDEDDDDDLDEDDYDDDEDDDLDASLEVVLNKDD
jgi:hypothetical protein